MKTKNLLLTGLLTLGVLTACSNEDDLGTTTDNPEGKAYTQIAFSIANSASTRASNVQENVGTEGEYTASKATILFVQNGQIAYSTEKTLRSSADDDNKKVYITDNISVAPGVYKIYALVNYDATAMKGSFTEGTAFSSTAMLSGANITNGKSSSHPYAKSDNFLMTNTEEPSAETLTSAYTAESPKTITIEVERIVSKVTFTSQTTTEFTLNSNSNYLKATLQGVDLINLNTKTNLIKQKATDVTYQTTDATGAYYTQYSDLYYVSDPNMGITASSSDFAHPSYDATSAISSFTSNDAIFYTLENTMDAVAQKNGLTTGLRYKVQYEIATTGANTTKFVDKSYLSSTQQNLLPREMTDAAWTTAETANAKTFYSYQNLLFRNKKALAVYIAATKSGASQTTVKDAYENETTSGLVENKDYQKYDGGIAYYSVWIKHNPDSAIPMEKGRYGMVRNHWYDIKVTDIQNFGSGSPDTEDPTEDDDPGKANIKIQVKIMPWRYISQNVIL